jgi:AraC-like DNA-binding protein
MVDRPWPRALAFSNQAFPFELFDMTPHPNLAMHSHEDFSELVVVHSGRGVHTTANGEYTISAGDVFVVTGDLAHGYKDVDSLCLVNVVYDASIMLRGVTELKRLPGYNALFHLEPRYRRQHWFESRLRLPPDQLDRLLTLLEEIAGIVLSRKPGYELRTRIRFLDLICFLCEQYAGSANPATRSLLLMDDIIHFIESNANGPVALQDLTDRAGMAERTLLQLFREATGVSPIDYVIRTRVARAADLLRNTRQKVTEIAFQCGFQDSSYFARQFRRVTGMSPSAYRSRYTRRPVGPL